MGWARGTELFDGVIDAALPMTMTAVNRQYLFEKILDLFMDYDWDCINESKYWENPDFQVAYQKLCPDY